MNTQLVWRFEQKFSEKQICHPEASRDENKSTHVAERCPDQQKNTACGVLGNLRIFLCWTPRNSPLTFQGPPGLLQNLTRLPQHPPASLLISRQGFFLEKQNHNENRVFQSLCCSSEVFCCYSVYFLFLPLYVFALRWYLFALLKCLFVLFFPMLFRSTFFCFPTRGPGDSQETSWNGILLESSIDPETAKHLFAAPFRMTFFFFLFLFFNPGTPRKAILFQTLRNLINCNLFHSSLESSSRH